MKKYNDLFSMEGKTALVAGGAGAIGAAIAEALAEYGAAIAIADRLEQAAVETAARISPNGSRAAGFAIDITNERSVEACFAAAKERFGSVDIMVNAAGIHIEQPAADLSLDAWDKVLNVNLRGAFLLSQAAARVMIAQGSGGSQLHVTSVRSSLGIRRGYAAYCASKGGLGILIKQLATEWAQYGIRVNGIAPTFTRTPLVENYLNDPDFLSALVNRIPLGRVCETADLAGIAIFLASNASSFITGQNIFVDGGVTATQ